LAAWVQVSISSEEPNPFAEWIYNFLDSWAVALGAAVTLLLVIAAFLAVLDSRNTRMLDRNECLAKEERDKKELLLDRIREWAEYILIVGIERDIEPLWVTARDSGHSVLRQMMNTFRTLRRKGQYISGITLTTWPTLHGIVEEMRSELLAQTEAISEYDKDPSETKLNTANEHRDVVNKLADSIIDEVSRIQTTDMD